eukprot:11183842-Alexandrium_andersonii.AAC.1
MQPVSDQVGAGLARRAQGREAATQQPAIGTDDATRAQTICQIVWGCVLCAVCLCVFVFAR